MGLSFFKSVFSIQVILDCILSESSEPQWCKNRRQDTFYSDNLSSVNTYGAVKSSFVGGQSFSSKSYRGHRTLLQVSCKSAVCLKGEHNLVLVKSQINMT